MNQAGISRSGGQVLIGALKINSVDRVFCIPGESFLAALDALYDAPEIALTVRNVAFSSRKFPTSRERAERSATCTSRKRRRKTRAAAATPVPIRAGSDTSRLQFFALPWGAMIRETFRDRSNMAVSSRCFPISPSRRKSEPTLNTTNIQCQGEARREAGRRGRRRLQRSDRLQ